MKHLVIFGTSGMLGSYLANFFSLFPTVYNVIPIFRKDFTVTNEIVMNPDYLEGFLCGLTSKLDSRDQIIVINAIGIINVVNASKDMYTLVNHDFPHVLANVCEHLKWTMIHASTDCVFDGKSNGNYTEDCLPDATDDYGVSKQNEPLNAMVIRCSIIGVNRQYPTRGFINFLINSKNKEISGYTNHYWNGITCLEYAKMLDTFFSANIVWKGIRHIVPPYTISKYEMCTIINDIFKLGIQINPVESEPSNKVLHSNFETKVDLLSFEKQIQELALFDNISN